MMKKYVVKFLLDLSEIKKDPELETELYKKEKPIKVAAVRNNKILGAMEIEIRKIEDFSKISVTLEFDHPTEKPPGAYIIIGPNLPEKEFLRIEAKKIWVPPKKFKDNIADITKEKLFIPKYLFRRWLILCRTFTITGRVVRRVWKWDQIEQMYVPCDEPVPGAKVEAFDVDCWWFWWKKDLVGSAITNPDGTFELKFAWCCLAWLPILKPRWIIDPDLLKHFTEAVTPHVGPIPPEALKSPVDFEGFLGGGTIAGPSFPLPPPVPERAEFMSERYMEPAFPVKDLISKIRPLLPPLPCWWPWPFRFMDCSPDIVFKVTQECEGVENVIYTESVFQTRWNVPANLNVTLFANEKACSIPVCEEPPVEDCLKFSWVNCVSVENIGTSSGPPDLRGYASPGSADNPFAETVRIRGLFGALSDVDYFKVQYSYNDGVFKDMPKDTLVAFTRSYWAPPVGSPPSTPAKWNHVIFKPEDVDGEVVYKTLTKAEEENPLPAGWTWGYLWNDFSTLFRWNSRDLEGDGLYTIRLVGYRWNETTEKLENDHIMETCEMQTSQEERVMIRIDNRLANDPLYESNEDRPCGPGTIHLCTYEPDCDFREVIHVKKDQNGNIVETKKVGACDIIELSDNDDIVIHFNASVPKTPKDGHLLGYHMYAHWGENKVFNVLTGGTLEPDPDDLVGPGYGNTFTGAQGTHRGILPIADPEHDRPSWFGGNFKVTVKGDKFVTCAYTLKLRVWKRTIVSCQNPYHVHVNWCSYSFTIKKV